MYLRFLKLTIDGEEILHPRTRRIAYRNPSAVAHVLRPVSLRCWVCPKAETEGTIEHADWEAAGFAQPVVGRVSHALHVAGRALPVLFDPPTGCWYVALQGKIFRAAAAEWEEPSPPWPWRILPWRDKTALQSLLGSFVSLWPWDDAAAAWSGFTEPLRVVAIYAEAATGQYGIGLSPALADDGQQVDDAWPFRSADTLRESLPVIKHLMGAALRPAIVLWAPASRNVPGMNVLSLLSGVANTDDDIPVWKAQKALKHSTFRIVLPDDGGSDPRVWDDESVSLSLHGAGHRRYPFCRICEDEGVFNVPVVKSGACLAHLRTVRGEQRVAATVHRETPLTRILENAKTRAAFSFPGMHTEEGSDG